MGKGGRGQLNKLRIQKAGRHRKRKPLVFDSTQEFASK